MVATLAISLLVLGVRSTSGQSKVEAAQRSRQHELEVVSRILSVFAKQEKDPCIPRGRILAIIRTEKPRCKLMSYYFLLAEAARSDHKTTVFGYVIVAQPQQRLRSMRLVA